MNNKYKFKKYSTLLILFFLIISFSFLVYSSKADDDEREDDDKYEERYEDDRYGDERLQNAGPVVEIPQIISESKVSTQVNNVDLSNLKDSDQDGISDEGDKYPGEDDFSYLLIDNNSNGVADDLEILIK